MCLGLEAMWWPRYFALVLVAFASLVQALLGGPAGLPVALADRRIRLAAKPLCCCCVCLPSVPVTRSPFPTCSGHALSHSASRRNMRWINGLILQSAAVRFILAFTNVVAHSDAAGEEVDQIGQHSEFANLLDLCRSQEPTIPLQT